MSRHAQCFTASKMIHWLPVGLRTFSPTEGFSGGIYWWLGIHRYTSTSACTSVLTNNDMETETVYLISPLCRTELWNCFFPTEHSSALQYKHKFNQSLSYTVHTYATVIGVMYRVVFYEYSTQPRHWYRLHLASGIGIWCVFLWWFLSICIFVHGPRYFDSA